MNILFNYSYSFKLLLLLEQIPKIWRAETEKMYQMPWVHEERTPDLSWKPKRRDIGWPVRTEQEGQWANREGASQMQGNQRRGHGWFGATNLLMVESRSAGEEVKQVRELTDFVSFWRWWEITAGFKQTDDTDFHLKKSVWWSNGVWLGRDRTGQRQTQK